MAKKKSSSKPEAKASKVASPAVAEEKKAQPKKVAPIKKAEKTEPLVSFARWFNSKKFKAHWAAGMEAFADTRRRRTMSEWDRLFKNY